MSWLEVIKGTVMGPRISDADIELLLSGSVTGSDETADLEIFISRLSEDLEPSRDPGYMATALAATVRASRPATRRSLRRVVALAASLTVLFAFSTVAMAADGAVPGDALYKLDRTLELIGIGDGGVDERIVEFDTLIQRGEDELAFDLLDEFAETANEDDATKAQRHIELAATNSIAADAQEKIAEKKTFIQENKGNGVGIDGADFGRGVADVARSDSNGGPQDDNSQGNNGNVTERPPDHAASGGNQEEPPGQSGETGPPTDPPANPGSAGNSGSTNESDGDNSGNGGNATSTGNTGSGNAGGNGNGPAQGSGKSDS